MYALMSFYQEAETAETAEGVALNMRVPYFYPTKTQFNERDIKIIEE